MYGADQVIYGANYPEPINESALKTVSETTDALTVIRGDLNWKFVEPKAPVNGIRTYNWSAFDIKFEKILRNHLTWMPLLWDPPFWAARYKATEATFKHSLVGDKNMPDWDAFVLAVVKRYGENGTFFNDPKYAYLKADPTTYNYVIMYEVLNEENNPYWTESGEVANYKTNVDFPKTVANIYTRTQAIIRANSRYSSVGFGALTQGNSGSDMGWFIDQCMLAKPNMVPDWFGLHIYSTFITDADAIAAGKAASSGWCYPRLRNFSAVLDKYATLNGVPVFLTELGWAVNADPNAKPFSDMSFTPPGKTPLDRMAGWAKNLVKIVKDVPLIEIGPSKRPVMGFLVHTLTSLQNNPLTKDLFMGVLNPDGTFKYPDSQPDPARDMLDAMHEVKHPAVAVPVIP